MYKQTIYWLNKKVYLSIFLIWIKWVEEHSQALVFCPFTVEVFGMFLHIVDALQVFHCDDAISRPVQLHKRLVDEVLAGVGHWRLEKAANITFNYVGYNRLILYQHYVVKLTIGLWIIVFSPIVTIPLIGLKNNRIQARPIHEQLNVGSKQLECRIKPQVNLKNLI